MLSPYFTPSSSSKTNLIRPGAEQIERASSVQSSAAFTSSLTDSSTPKIDVIEPYANILRHAAPVLPSLDPSAPPPLLKQPSTFISSLSSYSAPELAKTESSQMLSAGSMLSNDRVLSSATHFEPHPPSEDMGMWRPYEWNHEDPLSASYRPPVPQEYASLQGRPFGATTTWDAPPNERLDKVSPHVGLVLPLAVLTSGPSVTASS